MSVDEQIETIDITIEQAQEVIGGMESMQNLMNNPDFIKIVTEGYFKDEASRLVLVKADMEMQTPTQQEYITKAIDAIGFFKQYTLKMIRVGQMAQKTVTEHELLREQLLAEDN